MNGTTMTKSYYPSLDGLRGIAIILVVCHHNFDFTSLFNFGWVAVDLFFVLSGFLITDILLQTRQNKNFLLNFYIRRMLRIFPLYYLVVLFFFLAVPFISQLHDQYNYYHDKQEMAWFHLLNWQYIFNLRPNNNLLFNHFWSLSLEEQYYLTWPFVILLCKNLRRLARIMYIVIVICIVARIATWFYWGNGYTWFCFQYMSRFDGLCIGSLLAIWRMNDRSTATLKFSRFACLMFVLHLSVLLISKTILKGLPHFVFFGYTTISIVFGAIILFAIGRTTALSKVMLQNRVLTYFGKISYGLYVFHWPIFIIFKLFLFEQLIAAGINNFTCWLLISTSAFATAILVSTLSYTFFEKRILALKDVITTERFLGKVREKLSFRLKSVSSK